MTYSSTFRAIGTSVSVVVAEQRALSEATELVRSHVSALDAAASRFRDDSEITALNAAAGRPRRVSWLLFVALEEGLLAARISGGVVSPTVGEALQRCGYDRDFDRVSPSGPPLRLQMRRVPGWQGIVLDRTERTVTLPKGVQVDLGATAKAGCADRAALAASALTETGVVVNLGGDLAVAGPPPQDGWAIRIADWVDAGPDSPSVTVAVRTGGLATSGTAHRRWTRGNQVLHHLIDPATGAPASPCWRTVTVVADTCLMANVASTAAVILGSAAPCWLAQRGFHARLVSESGRTESVGDWPTDAVESGPTMELAS